MKKLLTFNYLKIFVCIVFVGIVGMVACTKNKEKTKVKSIERQNDDKVKKNDEYYVKELNIEELSAHLKVLNEEMVHLNERMMRDDLTEKQKDTIEMDILVHKAMLEITYKDLAKTQKEADSLKSLK